MAKDISPLEKVVLKEIISYLTKINIGVTLRHNTGSFKTGNRFVSCGKPGTSDLSIEIYNSTITCWIEVKRETGKASPEQLEFLERQRSRGNPAFISHSVEELKEQLKAVGLI